MLLQIPDLLTTEQVAHARRLLADAPWQHGSETAGRQAAVAKNNLQLPLDCEAARTISRAVVEAVERSALMLTATLPRRIYAPRVNRYGGDWPNYGEHVDNAVRFDPETGEQVRTDISCTVFLSDPVEYDGGELQVRDTFAAHGIKLPAGHAVIYPGTSVHQVTAVTRGCRLACFFWIESLVRSAEQRRLLFDFDMALMHLREAHGEDTHTVALSGTYHNLLRMWAGH
ncbi:MAG: Fe2+-dependent dioxygenase [Zoogloeaceae bacterium]|nr:Fe2+-dependent dioxygenase [Rhodocyclaceae bacterium]MCP5236456.1 Fe2+-dependent dioxygenase [Zoogloeaceae bacterium]